MIESCKLIMETGVDARGFQGDRKGQIVSLGALVFFLFLSFLFLGGGGWSSDEACDYD